jgi:putative chitinase
VSINFKAVQGRLGIAADGIAGPVTFTEILAEVAGVAMPTDTMTALGKGFAAHILASGIADTAVRLGNFIGQAAHETEDFRFLREIWGPTPAQRGYEGRADLGNDQPGDGQRFLGRGIFQITGRANYADAGHRLGLDLVGNPQLAEQPDVAVQTAIDFWNFHHLSALADSGQEDVITRRINGGVNGIADRRALVAKAKALLS